MVVGLFIGWFSVVIGGDSLPQKKPDPAPLLHAAAYCGAALADGETIAGFAALLAAHPQARRLLLVVDQFGELYTLCRDAQERLLFLDNLLETRKNTPNFTLVLTLRADFLGQALSYRPFGDALQYADLKLSPMNREELQAAVEQPAPMLGVTFKLAATNFLYGAALLLAGIGFAQRWGDPGAIVNALPPREASEMLVTKARQRARGGGDNLSLALVRVELLGDR